MNLSQVFISFSFDDVEFCTRLYNALKSFSIDVWFAPYDMKGGQKIIKQISYEIGRRDKVIVVLSKSSMDSNWVRNRNSQNIVERGLLWQIFTFSHNAM